MKKAPRVAVEPISPVTIARNAITATTISAEIYGTVAGFAEFMVARKANVYALPESVSLKVAHWQKSTPWLSSC